jgi:hypothetical protein
MSPKTTAAQADQLGDLFLKLSMTCDAYRADHAGELSLDDRHRLADIAQHLDDFSEAFTAQAITATLASIQVNISNISDATKDAQRAVKTAAKIQEVFSIGGAAVALAASIVTLNPGTIASAAAGLVSAIGGAVAPAGAAPGTAGAGGGTSDSGN